MLIATAGWGGAYLLLLAGFFFVYAIYTAKTRFVWFVRNPSNLQVWWNVIGLLTMGALSVYAFLSRPAH